MEASVLLSHSGDGAQKTKRNGRDAIRSVTSTTIARLRVLGRGLATRPAEAEPVGEQRTYAMGHVQTDPDHPVIEEVPTTRLPSPCEWVWAGMRSGDYQFGALYE